jgi:hypothetical protein
MLKKIKKNDTITIIGRRWFEKINGNTYHSCEVYVNGEFVNRVPFTYGYDSQYTQTAREILEKVYTLPIDKNEALWRIKDHGVKLVDSVTDVNRKHDL